MRSMSVRVRLVLIATIVVIVALVLVRCTSLFSSGGPVGLAYQSKGWSYLQVGHGAQQGFQAPGFDTGSWQTGQAGFGTVDKVCPWNTAAQVHTPWQLNTDMLLRHDFLAQTGSGVMHINGTVDNDADVYVNGVLITHVHGGGCGADGINVDIPARVLRGINVIAIRAADFGDADYIDVQIVHLVHPTTS